MIRNIPNKYSTQMLLNKFAALLPVVVDFLYLPMDHHNKCNVGYAFVNVSEQWMVPLLYDLLNNKRWDHFNSGKVCGIRGTTDTVHRA
jgi:hypothetical protein